MSASAGRDESHHPCRFLPEGHTSIVPFSLIRRILGVNKGTVKQYYKRCLGHPDSEGRPGMPPILTEVQSEELAHEIEFADDHGFHSRIS
jgi:hypothetical protein